MDDDDDADVQLRQYEMDFYSNRNGKTDEQNVQSMSMRFVEGDIQMV